MTARKALVASVILAFVAACVPGSTGTSSPGSGGITSFQNFLGDTCYRDNQLPERTTLPNGIVVSNEFCEVQYDLVSMGLRNGDLERQARNSPAPSDTQEYLSLARTFVSAFEAQDLRRAMRAARALTSVEAAWALGRSGFSAAPSGSASGGGTSGSLGQCLYVAERSANGINYGIRSSCHSQIESRRPAEIWCDLESGTQSETPPGIAIFRLVRSHQYSCFGCGVTGANPRLTNCRHHCDANTCP